MFFSVRQIFYTLLLIPIFIKKDKGVFLKSYPQFKIPIQGLFGIRYC